MDWEVEFRKLNSIWYYSENKSFHVKTSSNIHTDIFFNTDYVVCHPQLITEIVLKEFVPEIERRGITADWVITYPPYGIPIAFELARCIKTRFGYIKSRKEKECYFDIKQGESVIIALDDIHSGESLLNAFKLLAQKNVIVGNTIFCLANFSNKESVCDKDIFSLIKKQANFWYEDDCPMCKEGSIPVYHRANWIKLIGCT